MERAELEKCNLKALRQLALERGIDGSQSMSRRDLVDALETKASQPVDAPQPTAASVTVAPIAEPAPDPVAEPPRKKRAQQIAEELVGGPRALPFVDDLDPLSMARRFEAEGEFERALDLYDRLAALDPEDDGIANHARQLRERAQLPQAKARAVPNQEPYGMLDYEELPETYGVDECEILFKDPEWAFVYWEVTEAGLKSARAQLGPSADAARLVLRLFVMPAHGTRTVEDIDLRWQHGRRYLHVARAGVQVRVATGLLSQEGYFAPIAHSQLIKLPPSRPSRRLASDWIEVVPARSRGKQREPIEIARRLHDRHERGVGESAGPVIAPSSPTGKGNR